MDFVEFYQSTSPRTVRYAYGLTGDLQQAQDVTQEAYVRAWQRWRKIGAYEDAEAWLRLVVTRLTYDWWRRLGVRQRHALQPPTDVPAPSEDTVLLTTALRSLPEAQRRALALHYLLDLSVAQIAAETKVSEGTVKSWLSRGRAGLADALRAEATQARLPGPDRAAEAGQRRKNRRTAVAAAAATMGVLLAGVLVVTKLGGSGHTPPTQPAGTPSSSSASLGKLEQFGGVAVPLPSNMTYGMASILDGIGFVGWHDESGQLKVGAIELATGRQRWPVSTMPGGYGDWNGMFVLPNALVAIGEHDDGTEPDKTMFVLDPGSGKLRWRRGMDVNGFDLLPFSDAMVLADRDHGMTVGIDWVTGAERWRISRSVASSFGVQRSADVLASPSDRMAASMPTGKTFFQVDRSGTMTEYVVATGRPTGRRWQNMPVPVTDERVSYAAYDDQVFIVDGARLSRLDLAKARPVKVYEAAVPLAFPDNPVRLSGVTPCGEGAICLLDGDRVRTDLVVLGSGGVMSRHGVDGAETIRPMGKMVLVQGEAQEGGPWHRIVDLSGREVLAGQADEVLPLDPVTLLEMPAADPESPSPIREVVRVDLPGGNRTRLGEIPARQFMIAVGGSFLITANGEGVVLFRMS